MAKRIGFLVSHPIQYYAPIFRELARRCDLTVFFAHRQTPEQQARAGFGVAFDWDVDLLSGYDSRFLVNVARQPSTDRFAGCDTPGIADEIARGKFDAFVVPGWALRSYWQAVRACRRFGVPVLVRGDSQLGSQRNSVVRIAKAVAFPHLLRRFDGFLYVGQRNREYLLHYGVPADRLFFSPHCVDNDAFAAAAAASRAPGRRRILFVGKLIARKRPSDLLRAVARLGDPRRKLPSPAPASSKANSDKLQQMRLCMRIPGLRQPERTSRSLCRCRPPGPAIGRTGNVGTCGQRGDGVRASLPWCRMRWVAAPTSSSKERRARSSRWVTLQRSPLPSRASCPWTPIMFDAVSQPGSRCTRRRGLPVPSWRRRRTLARHAGQT